MKDNADIKIVTSVGELKKLLEKYEDFMPVFIGMRTESELDVYDINDLEVEEVDAEDGSTEAVLILADFSDDDDDDDDDDEDDDEDDDDEDDDDDEYDDDDED